MKSSLSAEAQVPACASALYSKFKPRFSLLDTTLVIHCKEFFVTSQSANNIPNKGMLSTLNYFVTY